MFGPRTDALPALHYRVDAHPMGAQFWRSIETIAQPASFC